MSVAGAFDLLLGIALLTVAAVLLFGAGFLRTIVLFIALGLLMSLAWVRLMAPDIALAEAAIGAGITGVLLVDALRHMEWGKKVTPNEGSAPPAAEDRGAKGWRFVAVIPAVAMLALMIAALFQLGAPHPELAEQVRDEMDPVEHPVTAVLLVFRSLDTLLELGILLLAVLGMLTVRGRRGLASVALHPPRDPVLENAVRVLVPLSILASGYMLWLGSFAAGGAFQAGVVLGAAGILLWLSGHRSVTSTPTWLWQTLVLLGFVAFIITASLTLFWSEWTLQLPERQLHPILLAIEAAATISIGATFAALFVGLHPRQDSFNLGHGGSSN